MSPHTGPAIDVASLNFQYTAPNSPPGPLILEDVNLVLPRGSICVLVGANGAGKSTLLQILAGKKLTRAKAQVLGQDVFFNTPLGVTYLGTEWATNPVVRCDIVVSHFLDSIGGYRHKERRDRLLDILDVDLDWHMNAVSDGERRRVQIVSGLMAPWDVLLLDEVTVDLDVLIRSRLLSFLQEECSTRAATILYATHIFDGLDHFPTHLLHLREGTTPTPLIAWPAAPGTMPKGVEETMKSDTRTGSKLLVLALAWLGEDREVRVTREKAKGTWTRGPRPQAVPEDSESFYRKYDYHH